MVLSDVVLRRKVDDADVAVMVMAITSGERLSFILSNFVSS